MMHTSALLAQTNCIFKLKKMKRINKVCRISIKTDITDGSMLKLLASKEFEETKILVEPGLTAYVLPEEVVLELYGPGSCYPDYLFKTSNTVIGFKVQNLEETVRVLENEGASLLGRIERVCDNLLYCHMQLSSEIVIGLFQYLPPTGPHDNL